MIDTNIVNYAMNKITATIGAMSPTIQNVSESYIKFVVSQQVVHLIGFVMCGLLAVLIWMFLYKTVRKSGDTEEIWFVIPTCILAFIFCFCLFGTISKTMDTYLAVNNPEAFTINKIIQPMYK